jgi:hypothetical protein
MNANPKRDPITVLRSNVEALLIHAKYVKKDGTPNWHAFVKASKLPAGNVQRISEAQTSIGIALVGKVAACFGLEAWQLLLPGLDPSNPPVFVMTESERSLYRRFRDAAHQLAEADT